MTNLLNKRLRALFRGVRESRTPKLLQQREVGFGKLVIHQFVEGDPAEVGDFELLGFAGEDARVEEMEPDIAVGIGDVYKRQVVA